MFLIYDDHKDELDLRMQSSFRGVKWKGVRPVIEVNNSELRVALNSTKDEEELNSFIKYFREHLIPSSNQTDDVINNWNNIINTETTC